MKRFHITRIVDLPIHRNRFKPDQQQWSVLNVE